MIALHGMGTMRFGEFIAMGAGVAGIVMVICIAALWLLGGVKGYW